MSNFPNNQRSYDPGIADAGTATETAPSVWDYLNTTAPAGERKVTTAKAGPVKKNLPQQSATLRTSKQLMPVKAIGLIVLIAAILGTCYGIKSLMD